MHPLPHLILTSARRFEQSTWLRTRLEDMCAQDIDAVQGPAELTVMGIAPDVVFTKEAWPHTDPKWAGRVFFTMTVDGDMFQFGSLSCPDGMRASAGKVFCVDPLELHWLRPDPVASTGWVALQWVVPREQVSAFELALAAAINVWNAPTFCLPQLGVELD
jgi:hypothetical protein